jgi:SAM-dependent methyltransferase
MVSNPYESSRLLSEYLLFHFGSAEQTLGGFPGPSGAVGFPVRLVEELLDTQALLEMRDKKSGGPLRGLDVGCAVGGSSFALSQFVDEVVGIDFSHSFIQAARQLQENGWLDTEVTVEGHRTTLFRATVPAVARRACVQFEVGDATALRDDLGPCDVLLAANLICRLPEPRAFLRRAADLVPPGGQFLLTTPFTWMEEYTPADQWLGAQATGADSFSVLQDFLAPNFALAERKEIPFLLREHSRKFQYTVACGSRWIRKAD